MLNPFQVYSYGLGKGSFFYFFSKIHLTFRKKRCRLPNFLKRIFAVIYTTFQILQAENTKKDFFLFFIKKRLHFLKMEL